MKSLLFVAIASGLALAQHVPTVTIKNGTIQGATCPSTTANFYGSIPFAQAPIGNLRFAAPQSYDQKYNGTLDATKQPPSCFQFGSAFIGAGPQSEDW
jgi:carboxylesterase type B